MTSQSLPRVMYQRINSVAYVKVLNEHMKILLRAIPGKEMQDRTRDRKI